MFVYLRLSYFEFPLGPWRNLIPPCCVNEQPKVYELKMSKSSTQLWNAKWRFIHWRGKWRETRHQSLNRLHQPSVQIKQVNVKITYCSWFNLVRCILKVIFRVRLSLVVGLRCYGEFQRLFFFSTQWRHHNLRDGNLGMEVCYCFACHILEGNG